MKRRVSIRVDVELDATNPTGIDLAAADALAQIYVNSVVDYGGGHYGAKLIEKAFVVQDEQVLLDLVLQATGVSEQKFLKGRTYGDAQARSIFTHFARKYLEWSYLQIARYLQRDKSTIAKSARAIGKQYKYREHGEHISKAMEKIQTAWSRIKE